MKSNRHRHRQQRRALAHLNRLLRFDHELPRPLSRANAVAVARKKLDALTAPLDSDAQGMYDAAVRGIGMSSLMSHFSLARTWQIEWLAWLIQSVSR